ncbi:MAG: class I SAM-dependent methyltransferase [Elusimicrobia bacterium]|nr:class I SAM-dependent methyltransferase [Elusimicrobiota bacterium]
MPDARPLEEVACCLCRGNRSRVLFHRPYEPGAFSECGDFGATTDRFQNYGRIVRCLDCGHVFTNPRPAAPELLDGYGACVDQEYLAESSSRSINAHLSLNTIKRFVRSGKLVEAGASVGYFLNAARADFEVTGLEPSRWACDIARQRFKLDMLQEPVEGLSRLAPGSLDVVAMIDVIEHLADPTGAAAAAARALKPGGLLYLVTPDIDSLSARLLRGYWWGLRPAHIHYFSRASLGRMLAAAGFEVVRSASFGRIFSYGYWASRLRHYPAFLYRSLTGLIRAWGVEDKFLYLNTRDAVEVCARKRAAA